MLDPDDFQAKQSKLSPRFDDALLWAHQLHRQQRRDKGGGADIPYVVHLFSVCALVLEDGGDEDEAIAALLHDSVEDQGGIATLKEIRSRFGDRVGDIVWSCSDTSEKPKPDWKERKASHLRHLKGASRSVRRVIAADKVHNGRSIVSELRRRGPALWGSFKGGRDGTLWYYEAMLEILREDADSSFLVDELARTIVELRETA